ncbi:sodium-dependent transporter [Myxococcota bacterium]|nr:sodium-dependent transporter [Myxococcota bacterium]MCZ7619954.1 sodium-dependent transporter [Myxococcota bacterium]
MTTAPREHWGSRTGFMLAAIGSAVGLGNMWRFSYLAAENGGAAFVLLYLAMTAGVALPVLLAELMLGRGAQQGPLRALVHFGGARWRPLGWLFVGAGFLILSYYGVIAGWTLRYTAEAIWHGFPADAAAHFAQISAGPVAVAWHLGFLALTAGIVAGGIQRGIERASVVLMPLLFAILAGLAVYAATVPGAGTGYAYYLQTDFGELLSLTVLRDAAGQAFFSLSLGMGAMMTYASYLRRDADLPDEAVVIALSDFAVAFVAGLVVFPLLFALGLQQDVGASTIGALFITLPHAFAEMGAAGRAVGLLFFAALLVGALTSAISLLEVVVSSAIDRGWSRPVATLGLGGAVGITGIAAALDTAVLGVMDQIAGNVLLILGGLAIALFVGWSMRDPEAELAAGAGRVHWFFLWRGLLRFVVPAVLAVVLASAIPAALQSLRALFD